MVPGIYQVRGESFDLVWRDWFVRPQRKDPGGGTSIARRLACPLFAAPVDPLHIGGTLHCCGVLVVALLFHARPSSYQVPRHLVSDIYLVYVVAGRY